MLYSPQLNVRDTQLHNLIYPLDLVLLHAIVLVIPAIKLPVEDPEWEALMPRRYSGPQATTYVIIGHDRQLFYF